MAVPARKSSKRLGTPGATRTAGTIADYRDRARKLADNLPDADKRSENDEPAALVEWFLAQNEKWKPSSVRYYRASIRQHVEDHRKAIGKRQQKRLLARLKEGPRPRKARRPRRTSARKRKTLPFPECEALLNHLKTGTPDADLAAEFLKHNCVLFMRKREWETADIVDGCLAVNNAKRTNGRSFGPTRRRRLDDYGADDVESLRMLLVRLKARAAEIGFKRLWQRMASLIARACKRIKIARVSLYTSRHQGMANAKAWMSDEQVAAAAGHKTTRTAALHYAKRRSGWGDKIRQVCPPHDADVARVISVDQKARMDAMFDKFAKLERQRQAVAQTQLDGGAADGLPLPKTEPHAPAGNAGVTLPNRTPAKAQDVVPASGGRRDDSPGQGIAAQATAPRSTKAAEPKSPRTQRAAAQPPKADKAADVPAGGSGKQPRARRPQQETTPAPAGASASKQANSADGPPGPQRRQAPVDYGRDGPDRGRKQALSDIPVPLPSHPSPTDTSPDLPDDDAEPTAKFGM